ncbi:YicC/YloC family endoribonuclease [Nitrosomonas sp. Is37]|uniref:YicC/YloC family endoribonuclease n=1 Tax=Nitrosomonas sp. Is37 TaxID=3080535 RepID=UPI00294B2AF7|nr:YicC/YloC family endoribonuclease [Nitrosomonas sp. Is37]MDV6345213.1 YicC/YloC family endoribonuclease [Nitrosomonas sp. Is37]
MIASMTGYAVISKEIAQGSLTLELRSVNNRYLDIQFRLPDEFRSLEPAMRELLNTQLKRGKIDCRLTFMPRARIDLPQQLNAQLFNKLLELNNAVRSTLLDAKSLSVADILRWPGILQSDILSTPELHEACMELLQATLNEFTATRVREGEKLKNALLERLRQLRQLTTELSPRIPILLANFQEKLIVRLQEAKIDYNDERIRQELTLFASKIDIDEELSRLQTHLDEVEHTLLKGGCVGKRLDFLMQELNREANTLGSKSVDVGVSKISIELKVLIEQMREQVQNIE